MAKIEFYDNDFCDYELCRLAVEKGFDHITRFMYLSSYTYRYIEFNINMLKPSDSSNNPVIPAIKRETLRRWLREEHDIDISIMTEYVKNNTKKKKKIYYFISGSKTVKPYSSYNDALDDALKLNITLLSTVRHLEKQKKLI